MSTFQMRRWIVGLGIAALLCANASLAIRCIEAAEAPAAVATPPVTPTAAPPVVATAPVTPPAGTTPATTTPQVWNTKGIGKGSGIPAKYLRYAQRVIKKADRNADGVLDENEWTAISGDLGKDLSKVDRDPKGALTVDELAAYIARYARLHPIQTEDTAWQRLPQPPSAIFQPVTSSQSPDEESPDEEPASDAQEANMSEGDTHDKDAMEPTGDDPASTKKKPRKGKTTKSTRGSKKYHVADSALPTGLPDWFSERDLDGDGQLTLGEFAPDGSHAQRQAFKQYDQNGDGVITPDEATGAAKTSTEKKASSASKDEPTQ